MKNLDQKILDVLRAVHFPELHSNGEIFDGVLGLVRFFTKILKKSGYKHTELIEVFGLDDDVEAGMPTDSESVLAYSMTANICNSLFAEKNEENAIKSEVLEKVINEYESNRVSSKLH